MPHRRTRLHGRLRPDVDEVLRVTTKQGDLGIAHCRDVTIDGFEIETQTPVSAGASELFEFKLRDVLPLVVTARCVNCRAAAKGPAPFVSAWEFVVRTDVVAAHLATLVKLLQPYRVSSASETA